MNKLFLLILILILFLLVIISSCLIILYKYSGGDEVEINNKAIYNCINKKIIGNPYNNKKYTLGVLKDNKTFSKKYIKENLYEICNNIFNYVQDLFIKIEEFLGISKLIDYVERLIFNNKLTLIIDKFNFIVFDIINEFVLSTFINVEKGEKKISNEILDLSNKIENFLIEYRYEKNDRKKLISNSALIWSTYFLLKYIIKNNKYFLSNSLYKNSFLLIYRIMDYIQEKIYSFNYKGRSFQTDSYIESYIKNLKERIDILNKRIKLKLDKIDIQKKNYKQEGELLATPLEISRDKSQLMNARNNRISNIDYLKQTKIEDKRTIESLNKQLKDMSNKRNITFEKANKLIYYLSFFNLPWYLTKKFVNNKQYFSAINDLWLRFFQFQKILLVLYIIIQVNKEYKKFKLERKNKINKAKEKILYILNENKKIN